MGVAKGLRVSARKRSNAGVRAVGTAVAGAIGVVVLLLTSGLVASLGPPPAASGDSGLEPAVSAGISILPLSDAAPIAATFWGINLPPAEPFTLTDAKLLATTPVTYIRYPGGASADGTNYTSGIVTNKTGSTHRATTPPSAFIASCVSIRCHAILTLPAEIDSPSTAAYYVRYVEKTLGFTPAYWGLGNEPTVWHHFDQPWSKWATSPTNLVTLPEYTSLLRNYTLAIRAVDPTTPIVAPSLGEGGADGVSACSTWCGPVVAADGSLLGAVSVHNYAAYPPPGPGARTVASFFALLRSSAYALPVYVPSARAAIANNYSGSLPLFLDEITTIPFTSGGESTYAAFTSQLYGGLFEAAQTTLLLALHVVNVDWFDWAGSTYGWYNASGGSLTPTGRVFQTFMTQLYRAYDPTTVTGPSTLYAAATTDGTNLSLLVVNVNTTASASFPLATLFSGTVNETTWAVGSSISTSKVANTTASAPGLSVSVWRGRATPVAEGLTASPSANPNPVDVGQSTKVLANPSGGSGTYPSFVWSGLPSGCGTPGNVGSFSCSPAPGDELKSPYTVRVLVTDSAGAKATGTFSLRVDPKAAATYSATFSERGLASGLKWAITLNGVTKQRTTDGTTDRLVWTGLSNGTYAYSIADNPGWHQATLPYNGHIAVSGAPATEPTLVYHRVTYKVTFAESGLPSGKAWSVTVNGVTKSSTGSAISFSEPNGTYSYRIGRVAGYVTTKSSGTVTVHGSGLTVGVKFVRSAALPAPSGATPLGGFRPVPVVGART